MFDHSSGVKAEKSSLEMMNTFLIKKRMGNTNLFLLNLAVPQLTVKKASYVLSTDTVTAVSTSYIPPAT